MRFREAFLYRDPGDGVWTFEGQVSGEDSKVLAFIVHDERDSMDDIMREVHALFDVMEGQIDVFEGSTQIAKIFLCGEDKPSYCLV